MIGKELRPGGTKIKTDGLCGRSDALIKTVGSKRHSAELYQRIATEKLKNKKAGWLLKAFLFTMPN